MGTNPFRARTYAMSPSYWQNLSPIEEYQLGRFPRQSHFDEFFQNVKVYTMSKYLYTLIKIREKAVSCFNN